MGMRFEIRFEMRLCHLVIDHWLLVIAYWSLVIELVPFELRNWRVWTYGKSEMSEQTWNF